MNIHEIPKETTYEAIPELTPDEEILIKFLRENGIPNNPDYNIFVQEREREVDSIQDPYLRKKAIEQFDMYKAFIIGKAGDLEYATELLYAIGKMAQETGDLDTEKQVDKILTSLGL